MYRILFFVLLFAILVPLVWRLVNKLFVKVTRELSNDKTDASDVIDEFVHQKDKIEERQRRLEDESRKAKKESDKLNEFLK